MSTQPENTEALSQLSDDELRPLMLRKREIEAMSREDMVTELMNLELDRKSSAVGGFEVHPESRLAALGKSPDEMFMADLKTNPAWFNVLWCIGVFAFIILFLNLAS